ncbi:MAG: hypothetical protein PHX87_02250 [Candidatus Peribacteraceae bacterium]|nr:hypothetical protein [Candidatus Peribacteraceae bacterium]MDD5742228.1 hypothetical protein [Candidatus Peribacteraceae bacterium]
MLIPYADAYHRIVELWDLAKSSGIAPKEIADVILDFEFLEIPSALDRFIRSRAVIIDQYTPENIRRVLLQALRYQTRGMPVVFPGNKKTYDEYGQEELPERPREIFTAKEINEGIKLPRKKEAA